MSRPSFVFLDPSGRRWPIFRRLALAVSIIAGVGLVLFVAAVWIRPAVRLPAFSRELRSRLKPNRLALTPDRKAQDWQRYSARARDLLQHPISAPAKVGPPSRKLPVRLAFFPNQDANATRSLREHAERLTHVAPDWLTVSGVESELAVESDPDLSGFLSRARALRNPDSAQPERRRLAAGSGGGIGPRSRGPATRLGGNIGGETAFVRRSWRLAGFQSARPQFAGAVHHAFCAHE